jgi:hypothetical protein
MCTIRAIRPGHTFAPLCTDTAPSNESNTPKGSEFVTKTAVAADDGDDERRREALGQIRDLLGQLGEVSPEDELRAEVAALRAEIRALRESPTAHTHHNCCGYRCCGHVHYWPYHYTSVAAGYNPAYAVSTTAGNYMVSNTAAGGAGGGTATYQIDF